MFVNQFDSFCFSVPEDRCAAVASGEVSTENRTEVQTSAIPCFQSSTSSTTNQNLIPPTYSTSSSGYSDPSHRVSTTACSSDSRLGYEGQYLAAARRHTSTMTYPLNSTVVGRTYGAVPTSTNLGSLPSCDVFMGGFPMERVSARGPEHHSQLSDMATMTTSMMTRRDTLHPINSINTAHLDVGTMTSTPRFHHRNLNQNHSQNHAQTMTNERMYLNLREEFGRQVEDSGTVISIEDLEPSLVNASTMTQTMSNMGTMTTPRRRPRQGYEMEFGAGQVSSSGSGSMTTTEGYYDARQEENGEEVRGWIMALHEVGKVDERV